MTAPTTSTFPVFVDALMDALAGTELAAYEAYPGADGKREMLYLTDVSWDDYRIPTIKAGRQQRQEDYRVGFELVALGAGPRPTTPKPARERTFGLLAVVENALANDPVLAGGLGPDRPIQRVELSPDRAQLVAFDKGWAYVLTGTFEVHARLL